MDPRERAFEVPEGALGRLGGWWMARRNRPTVEWVVDLLDVAADHRVLEVGYGPGVGVEVALARDPSVRVAGVDPSDPMLAAARERNREAVEAGRADLRAGVAEELPFEADAFERAFGVDVYGALEDPAAALAELGRVLGAGGRLALGFTPGEGHAAEGLTDDATRAGFRRARRRVGEAGVCVVAET